MNNYRIKYHHDSYLQRAIYMPQHKCWWGWSNLINYKHDPYNKYNDVVHNEQSAKDFIQIYHKRSMNNTTVTKVKTKIIDVQLQE